MPSRSVVSSEFLLIVLFIGILVANSVFEWEMTGEVITTIGILVSGWTGIRQGAKSVNGKGKDEIGTVKVGK